MGFINDLKNAVDNYETDNCKTEIVNFSITGDGGAVLNEGETFEFKVRVINQSHLDMKNVRVRVRGTMYADVAWIFGPFLPYIVSGPFNIDAHQRYTTSVFRGRAKAVTGGLKNIVTARIDSWDASLDHILIDHTGAGAAEGRLNKEIMPD
jgi:hypothetical protein